MTAAQRAAIVLPATGPVVFQTDGTAGLYFNAGTSGHAELAARRRGRDESGQCPPAARHLPPASNVGIQRSSPVAPLDVLGGNWDARRTVKATCGIGDGTTRLKIGIATGGGGTGGDHGARPGGPRTTCLRSARRATRSRS